MQQRGATASLTEFAASSSTETFAGLGRLPNEGALKDAKMAITKSEIRQLPKMDVRDFVGRFLAEDKHYKRTAWGPFDDFVRFCLVAISMPMASLPDVEQLDAIEDDHPPVSDDGKLDAVEFIHYAARYLYALNPVYSETRWAQLVHAVMIERKRIKPGYVRIRQEPALGKRLDATWMTPTQLRAKYPDLCPSRIYKLIDEAKAYYLKPIQKK